jgi:hypothetical protein
MMILDYKIYYFVILLLHKLIIKCHITILILFLILLFRNGTFYYHLNFKN